MHEEDRKRYARKSLNGIALGDGFGETFFFDADTTEHRIQNRILPEELWTFTDDTVMAIAIYRILEKYRTIDADKLADAFGKNYQMDWHRGYGGTAHSILRAIGEGQDWREVSSHAFEGMGSMGNGAAMRVAPIGAYFMDDFERVVEEAEKSAIVTHTHPEGIAGAIAVAIAAAHMLKHHIERTECVPEEFLSEVAKWVPESDTRSRILSATRISNRSRIDFVVSVLGNGSRIIAQDTVPFALWCAAHYHHSLIEALWMAVSARGDMDTICAIVGGIVSLFEDDAIKEWGKYIENPEDSIFFQTEIR